MSFKIVIADDLKPVFAKLRMKDKARFIAVENKILQISECDVISIQHFKNLRGSMSRLKRVHVGSFVLIFRIKGCTIIFEKITPHDSAYRR